MRNTFGNLEQVQVRGMNRRSLRLKLVAGLGMMLTLPLVAASAQSIGTTTTMTAQSSTSSSCALTTLSVGVTGTTGVPSGTVTINDAASGSAVALGSETLSATGQATFVFALTDGVHTLSAAYAGNTTYSSSTSVAVSQTTTSQCTTPFVVTVSSLSPSNTLTAGDAGTGTVTLTPSSTLVPASGGTPVFITISCSGLPNQTSCSFTPATVEILPGQYEGVTSTMVLQTQAEGTSWLRPGMPATNGKAPVEWAILLPGILGLGGLAWGARRRAWLSRTMLLAVVGLVTMLGTTACNPRYGYFHHGPTTNLPTPAGTYTITVTGQSSNGVTATTENTTFSLTVK